MRWYNLVKNKCPECNKTFKNYEPDFIKCKCGFSISMTKFKKITNEILNKKNPPPVMDNQEALNNL